VQRRGFMAALFGGTAAAALPAALARPAPPSPPPASGAPTTGTIRFSGSETMGWRRSETAARQVGPYGPLLHLGPGVHQLRLR